MHFSKDIVLHARNYPIYSCAMARSVIYPPIRVDVSLRHIKLMITITEDQNLAGRRPSFALSIIGDNVYNGRPVS